MSLKTYFDYAASTPVAREVAEVMTRCLQDEMAFGNPHATIHQHGRCAADYIQHAAQQVAELLNCEPGEVVWTSGATEANNLAMRGVYAAPTVTRKTLITCETEHKSVLATAKSLQLEGVDVVILPVDSTGQIPAAELAQALSDQVALLSIMWVNNETGVELPIAEIVAQAHAAGALVHVDATQAVGKIPIDLQAIPIDLLSLSAHKFYGPKGAGALIVKNSVRMKLAPQITGGGQQRNLRSGTLAVHQAAGVGAACELARVSLAQDYKHAEQCKAAFLEPLRAITGINHTGDNTVPFIANFTVADVNGESLQYALSEFSLAAGSACTTENAEPSYVLKAMQISRALAETAIRVSFGRFTTVADAAHLGKRVAEVVTMLRRQAGK